MKAAMVTMCALVVCVSAGSRLKRSSLDESPGTSRIIVSSGYGAAYTGYGDFSRYRVAVPISRDDSAPAYVYTQPVTHKADVPQVVSVHKVVAVPQVVTVDKVVSVPSYKSGYIGYGSGLRSGYFGYSDRSGYARYAGSPGYSGYASRWW